MYHDLIRFYITNYKYTFRYNNGLFFSGVGGRTLRMSSEEHDRMRLLYTQQWYTVFVCPTSVDSTLQDSVSHTCGPKGRALDLMGQEGCLEVPAGILQMDGDVKKA